MLKYYESKGITGDYDSDTLLLSDNEILINAANRNYHLFDVPTSFVSAKKTKRYFTAEDKSDLDIKTSVNKIGEIVNLSQYLQSIMWDRIYKDGKSKNRENNDTIILNQKELYQDICKLAVLSGIEIDKAKKEFDVNTQKELHKLKSKYSVYVGDGDNKRIKKPMFFKMITLNNGYTLNPKHKYAYFHTPMDYLQKIINQFNFRRNTLDEITIPFSDIVMPVNLHSMPSDYVVKMSEKAYRVLDLIKQLKQEISSLYINYDSKSKEEKKNIHDIVQDKKEECINYINDISIAPYAMYLLVKEIDNERNSGYARLIFNILYGTPNQSFFSMIRDNSDNLFKLVEDDNGDIDLFGYKYSKIALNDTNTDME